MIDFKHHNQVLKEALDSGKRLLESSQSSLSQLNAQVLQNKDKYSEKELKAFDEALKEADRLRDQLKNM
jgi:hypothetical protein